MAQRPNQTDVPTPQAHQPRRSRDTAPRAGRRPRALTLFFACTFALLAADLLFKDWAFRNVAAEPVVLDRAHPERHVGRHEPWTIVPSVLSLHLSTNTGAVFGLGKGYQAVLALVSVVATGVIVWFFLRSDARAWLWHLALALVLAGALGNLHDRFRFAAVRDMLWLCPGVKLPFGWTWPGGNDGLYPWLFNIADAALVVGVLLLLTITWHADRRQRAARASAESDPG